MTKNEFITERTRIISEMLDNPDKYGIYPTTKCFRELDALYDKLQIKVDILDEDIERAFPTDLKVLAKTVKFPEMGLSYEAKEWFEARINDNFNRQIGAKAMRDNLIKKG